MNDRPVGRLTIFYLAVWTEGRRKVLFTQFRNYHTKKIHQHCLTPSKQSFNFNATIKRRFSRSFVRIPIPPFQFPPSAASVDKINLQEFSSDSITAFYPSLSLTFDPSDTLFTYAYYTRPYNDMY